MTNLVNISTTVNFTSITNDSASNFSVAKIPRDDLTREEQLEIVNIRLIIYAFIVLPLAVIGIVLNGFTIVVLLHPRMRNFSTNAYLTALSIANIFCLINFIFFYSLRYILSNEIFKKNLNGTTDNLDMHPYESFINFIYGLWSPIFKTFQLYAIYLTCAVTVDRWIYVTWPLKADTICTIRNTIRAILIIFIFCVIYNLPVWFEIESYQQVSKTNKTFYTAKKTVFGNNIVYAQIFSKYGYMVFVYGIPFSILLIVNIGIVQKLIEAKKRKRNLLGKGKTNSYNPSQSLLANNTKSASSKNETNTQKTGGKKFSIKSSKNIRSSIASSIKLDPKITIMVLAVVLAFFCCQFPYLIFNLLSEKYFRKKWFLTGMSVCNIFGTLNCCINFLIYCFFGQNFRQIAKSLLFNPSFRPYNHSNLNSTHNHSSVIHNRNSVCANTTLQKKKYNPIETTKHETLNEANEESSQLVKMNGSKNNGEHNCLNDETV